MKKIDMHVHTTASDGIYSPSQVIDLAVKRDLAGIAITDHDTVEGIGEALKYGKTKKDFIVIPGIELSTEINGEEIHILGYRIDYEDKELMEVLRTLKEQRVQRAVKITEKLRDLGLSITIDEVKAAAGQGILGRPHIAGVLVEKGYVKNTYEAFQQYLSKGCPAYVERFKLSPYGAIDLIKKVGGFAVVAHPGLIESEEILKELVDYGVDGIEVYHPDNGQEATEAYRSLAQSRGLLITGGSDFHHPPNQEGYHGDLGSKGVSIDSIAAILKTR